MNKCLSIITLNVNGLNAPIKRCRVAAWIRKQDLHICYLQEPHLRKRPTQTESEGLEKTFQANGQGKKTQGSITSIRQNRFKNKGHKKMQRKPLNNSKRKNPSGSDKQCKHICTQHKSTQIYKENLKGLQERYRQQHTCTRGF